MGCRVIDTLLLTLRGIIVVDHGEWDGGQGVSFASHWHYWNF
jgi:hypothetical protein